MECLVVTLTHHLQRVQNSAARLVTGASKYAHISPVLELLHWLPVEFRPQYKILIYTFKAIQNAGPIYLNKLVTPYQPKRCLRSSTEALIVVPKSNTVTYGNRCFTFKAATLWNSLPLTLRNAKTLCTLRKT